MRKTSFTILPSVMAALLALSSGSLHSEETLPEDGYTKYQRDRMSQSLYELESYGASIKTEGIGATKIFVDYGSLQRNKSDFIRVLTKETPVDTRGRRSMYIYSAPDFDLGFLIEGLSDGFSSIIAIPSTEPCDGKLSPICKTVEIHIL